MLSTNKNIHIQMYYYKHFLDYYQLFVSFRRVNVEHFQFNLNLSYIERKTIFVYNIK